MAQTPTHKAYTLDNGMQLFLQEQHEAPIASIWTWYRVGSRNELPGITGASHWVEHMQFKGTPSLEKGEIFNQISRCGGEINAMTSNDWTTYYETVPVSALDLCIQIESDRMANSIFDSEEVDSERTVILSELQGSQNGQTFYLNQEVNGAAFRGGPYGHHVLGAEEDLRSMTRDDLYNHYRRYYRPDNAFITAIGDFDADDLAARIEAAFSGIQNPNIAIPEVRQGPPQFAERRVTLSRQGAASELMMGYRIPGMRHEDIPALMITDSILDSHSRLREALVRSDLATHASTLIGPKKDESLWTIYATARQGVATDQIEEAIGQELERLKNHPPSDEEMAMARKQLRAYSTYSKETISGQAYWLGTMEIMDHADRMYTYLDECDRITADDVMRIAETYFVPDKCVVGWQHPSSDATIVDMAEKDSGPAGQVAYLSDSYGEANRQGFVRTVLSNGIVVLAQPRANSNVIDGSIQIKAGRISTGEEAPGVADMMGDLMSYGTENRTYEQIQKEKESIAATISLGVGEREVRGNWHSLGDDFDQVLDLASDIILNPIFPEEELERLKPRTLNWVEEMERNTNFVSRRSRNELIYPEGHPRRTPNWGTPETISAMTQAELAAYHAKWLGPSVTTIAITGGIADIDDAVQRIERVFGSWHKELPEPKSLALVEPNQRTQQISKFIDEKSQVDINIGYPTISRLHEDYYALQVADLILGQYGLYGRLGSEVRDRQGLAYSVSSFIDYDPEFSIWTTTAGVDPENVDKAIAGIEEQIRRMREEHVSDQELSDVKSFLIGSLPIQLESLWGTTYLLTLIEDFGLGLDYIDRFPEIISAITKEDVLRVAQEHLDPDRLAIGIAGPV